MHQGKEEPAEYSIGTCTVAYGRETRPVVICPHRLLERRQIFTDCLHLLKAHQPGNELHLVSEVSVPGGSVDYFVVSARDGKVHDFVGIELQTLDTTGTVWPERQKLLARHGVRVSQKDLKGTKSFGMNWKMTAKTILVQLHHKVATFEHINKHLVLVAQDYLMSYMSGNFDFAHMHDANLGDPMHIHAYRLDETDDLYRLRLVERQSTDTEGIAVCLGLQADPKVELHAIIKALEDKIGDVTRFEISSAGPPPHATNVPDKED